MGERLCDGKCVMDAILGAAEALVNEYPGADPMVALGGIAATRKSLELIRERVDCPGMTVNAQTGQLDCPLRELAYYARGMGLQAWPPAQFRLPLDSLVEDKTKGPSTGQYL